MRLVIEVGYQHLVFASGAQVSAVIAAFEGAVVCQSEGYGDTRRYVPQTGTELGIRLVPEGDVSLPDTAKGEVLERLLKSEAELQNVRGELYLANEKLKKVGAAVQPAAQMPTIPF